MMPAQTPDMPVVHLVQLLIRHRRGGDTVFLLHPHETWRPAMDQAAFLVLPARKTVADAFAPLLRGQSLELFVGEVMNTQLGMRADSWLLEEEIEPVQKPFPATHSGELKSFVLCPVDVWVAPEAREPLRQRLDGLWVTPAEALAAKRLAPSARAVFEHLIRREEALDARYSANPAEEAREENPHRLLRGVSDRPSMYALASRWFSQSRGGVRILPGKTLRAVLAAGHRAFNLRVADPYLRYQLQGVGFTWSFFTHKDRQDIHVHSAPTVEIYGVLEGRLEVWWKPYHDRGTSAWNRHVVARGDWVEMEALQCHYVRWLGEGMGVVFKAGPGPMAEVGRLGVKGKTTCDGCPCVKPPEMTTPAAIGVDAGSAAKPRGLSVRAIIRKAPDQILLLRRSLTSRSYAGQWELPGGKIDSVERFDEALIREVREETGLEIALGRCAGATDTEMPCLHVTSLFYEARLTGGSFRLSSEHCEFRWAPPADVGALDLSPQVRDVLLRLAPSHG
jgi:8-oxo-dGTP diphosphatase